MTCDLCEFAATTSRGLRKRKEAKHDGIRYPCEQCEYAATSSNSLKVHKEATHEYTASDSSTLKRHRKSKN